MHKQYEYREMMYLHHARREGLEQLNELGAEGWGPAFCIGRTLILCREVNDEPVEPEAEDSEEAESFGLPEATVDDWRDIYRALPDEQLDEIDADGVETLMAEAFALPTRSTLHRWADEARESVSVE